MAIRGTGRKRLDNQESEVNMTRHIYTCMTKQRLLMKYKCRREMGRFVLVTRGKNLYTSTNIVLLSAHSELQQRNSRETDEMGNW